MRIQDKHLGLLQPSDVNTLAELTFLILHLSHNLLTKVCQMVRQIPEDTLECIAVNLSGKYFEAKTIGETLIEIIKGEGEQPKEDWG